MCNVLDTYVMNIVSRNNKFWKKNMSQNWQFQHMILTSAANLVNFLPGELDATLFEYYIVMLLVFSSIWIFAIDYSFCEHY